MQLTQPTTRTLEAPGATVSYDVRPGSGGDIPLFLIGSPMGAAGFGCLASRFPDRTIITYDPGHGVAEQAPAEMLTALRAFPAPYRGGQSTAEKPPAAAVR